jgi:hypothetical protein
MSGKAVSRDQGTVEVEDGLDAVVLHTALPVGAQEIKAETVFFVIVLSEQANTELGPLRRVDDALEDGVLDPLTVVEAEAGDSAETAASSRRRRGNVIADEHHHGQASYFQKKGG